MFSAAALCVRVSIVFVHDVDVLQAFNRAVVAALPFIDFSAIGHVDVGASAAAHTLQQVASVGTRLLAAKAAVFPDVKLTFISSAFVATATASTPVWMCSAGPL